MIFKIYNVVSTLYLNDHQWIHTAVQTSHLSLGEAEAAAEHQHNEAHLLMVENGQSMKVVHPKFTGPLPFMWKNVGAIQFDVQISTLTIDNFTAATAIKMVGGEEL